MAGRELSDSEIADLWEAWTPSQLAERMSTVNAPWCVAAGWALELFAGEVIRDHDDLEIARSRRTIQRDCGRVSRI